MPAHAPLRGVGLLLAAAALGAASTAADAACGAAASCLVAEGSGAGHGAEEEIVLIQSVDAASDVLRREELMPTCDPTYLKWGREKRRYSNMCRMKHSDRRFYDMCCGR